MNKWNGLEIVDVINNFYVVDVRPILGKLTYQNSRAKKECRYASSKTPLTSVSSVKWAPAPTSYHTGQTVPSRTKMLSYKPAYIPANCYAVLAFYLQNGKWIAAHIGATREQHACSLYVPPTGKNYTSAGEIGAGWCVGWPLTCPTVQVLMDIDGKAICAVASNLDAQVDPTPEPTPTPTVYRVTIESDSPIRIIQ